MSLNKKLLLISFLYFAEGFPFGLIEQTLPVYFRIHGISLACLGLFSLLSLPYVLKFIWAPAVDFLGTRRGWISSAQFALAASMLALLALDPSNPNLLLWLSIASLALLSATQDIAIDSYSIELLETREMGMANGVRQAAYRIALIVSGGVFVAVGGWLGWKTMFLIAAAVLILCSLVSLRLPPTKTKHQRISLSSLRAPFADLLTRPRVMQIILFILFYKLSDLAMAPIVRPFWLARGLSTMEIGLIAGTFGTIAAIAGGLTGGIFMARFGIFHGLWFLGLWQSLSHAAYVWASAYPDTGHFGIYVASFSESFCSGLGTAAFLAFLMSICNKEYSATQYAVLSALFRVAGIIVGSLSGWMADELGYTHYFAVTFFLSLPAFAFILDVRTWIPDNNALEKLRPSNVEPKEESAIQPTLKSPVVALHGSVLCDEPALDSIVAVSLVDEEFDPDESGRGHVSVHWLS